MSPFSSPFSELMTAEVYWPARIGEKPANLLTGQAHAHWLELLGHRRFRRS